MIISWSQLWEFIVLIGLLYISNKIARPLGGFIHFLLTATFRIPLAGRIFSRIFQYPFYLNAIAKPLAWVISSSGLILGLVTHDFFWGPLNTSVEYWILLLFATFAIFETVNSIITFDVEYYYVDKLMPSMNTMPFFKQFIPNEMGFLDEDLFIRVVRSTFVDQAIVEFFHLLTNISMLCYALPRLSLIQMTPPNLPPTLWESILISLSLINIGELTIPFTGLTWQIIRLASTFISFFWLAMFISLASSTLDEVAKRAREGSRKQSEDWAEEIVKSAVEKIKLEQQNTYIRIIEALVNPKDGIDSGQETITLLNFGNNAISLHGWHLEDSDQNQYIIPDVTILVGKRHVVEIPVKTIYLRNSGGNILLTDHNGNIIHRVEYDASAIDKDGVVKWL